MPKYECSIHENKPLICRSYPHAMWTPGAHFMNGCSYYVEDGEVKGECNKCGKCCILYFDMLEWVEWHYIEMPTCPDNPQLDEKFIRGQSCPYLKEIEA